MDSGVRLCFSPSELHLSIPDEAFYHPVVKELQDASIDLVVLDNVSVYRHRHPLTGVLSLLFCLFSWCRMSPRTTESKPRATRTGTSSPS